MKGDLSQNAPRVDANVFDDKDVRVQKCPDKCGLGLSSILK